jgi:hypothetical protein
MNFEQLCKIEPELAKLENDIFRYLKSKERGNVVEAWYRKFKPKMLLLVGYSAKNPKMQRADYYDVIYLHLFELLSKDIW